VHPGGIKTNIARTSRIAAAADRALYARTLDIFHKALLKTEPADAARAIIDGIERKRDRVLIGNNATQVDRMTRWLGPRGSRLMSRRMLKTLPHPDPLSVSK